MRSSTLTTLFSEPPSSSTPPSAAVISLLLHGIGFAVLFTASRHMLRLPYSSVVAERYTVRLLKNARVDQLRRLTINGSEMQTATHGEDHDIAAGGTAPVMSAPVQLAQPSQSQMLLQPDAPPRLVVKEPMPIPLVRLWSAEEMPNRILIAPPPQEITVVTTRPALIRPNREPNLADVNMTMTPFPVQSPIFPTGTTSPIIVRSSEPAPQQISMTASTKMEQPTPAQVLSLSALQSDGPVAIPLANQAVAANSSDGFTTGRPDKAMVSGSGDVTGHQNGKGAGAEGAPAIAQSGAPTGTQDQNGAAAGLGVENKPAVTHLTQPKDGKFGVIVVGSPLAERYPEIEGVWHDRVVYTAYLRVGASKSWILQYSLPQAGDASANASTSRPDAPWPYDMLRPHLPSADYDADAILIHGFINMAGRFEKLALVFPAGFQQAKFLLDALQQWQFRPALQDGHVSMVEVLLIIPEEAE
ncbi:hypothetical protein [Terriglobus albidus]|uniref:hypothetical protein n=1 Tax=Terriglobus albidus TaxID=1592106 RepID=UPI0021E033C1|nr:hypothetical protein [Terriglobus albidus]